MPDDRASPRFATRYVMTFKVVVESSCSQSWDITTHEGEFALALDPGGDVDAALTLASRSRGPGYNRGDQPAACQWHGAANRTGDRISIQLDEPPRADRTPYQCAIEDHARQTRLRAFTLDCRRGRAASSAPGSLACSIDGPSPWLLSLTRQGGVIPMGTQRGQVHLEVRESDAIEGVLITPFP